MDLRCYTFNSLEQQKSFLHAGKYIAYAIRCQIHRRFHTISSNPSYIYLKIMTEFLLLLCPSRPSLYPIGPSAGVLGEGGANVDEKALEITEYKQSNYVAEHK